MLGLRAENKAFGGERNNKKFGCEVESQKKFVCINRRPLQDGSCAYASDVFLVARLHTLKHSTKSKNINRNVLCSMEELKTWKDQNFWNDWKKEKLWKAKVQK